MVKKKKHICPTACRVYSCHVLSGLKVMFCFSLVLSVLFPVLFCHLVFRSLPALVCFPSLWWSTPRWCVSAVCYYPYLPCCSFASSSSPFIACVPAFYPVYLTLFFDPTLPLPLISRVLNQSSVWKPWTACESCIRVYTWCVWFLSTTRLFRQAGKDQGRWRSLPW